MDATATPFVPEDRDIATMAAAARECQGCPLFKDAHQTVFGAGPDHATVMLVGEQPGDQEDRQGTPFVGPAGGKAVRNARDLRAQTLDC